jgi:hypothetical protein
MSGNASPGRAQVFPLSEVNRPSSAASRARRIALGLVIVSVLGFEKLVRYFKWIDRKEFPGSNPGAPDTQYYELPLLYARTYFAGINRAS